MRHGVDGPGSLRGLDDDHHLGQGRDQTVASGEGLRGGGGRQGRLREDGPARGDDPVEQGDMLAWIGAEKSAAEHGHGGRRGRVDRAAMRRAVDSTSPARDDDKPRRGAGAASRLGPQLRLGRGRARSHDGDGAGRERFVRAAEVQGDRRIMKMHESSGIPSVTGKENAEPSTIGLLHLPRPGASADGPRQTPRALRRHPRREPPRRTQREKGLRPARARDPRADGPALAPRDGQGEPRDPLRVRNPHEASILEIPAPPGYHLPVRRLPLGDLNYILIPAVAPVCTILEVTNSCNEKCFHCLRDSPDHHGPDPLSTADWFRVIDDIADLRGLVVVFTGGECTNRADLLDLIRHARDRGLAASIKTNGLRLTKEYVENLWQAGVRRMEISVYGAQGPTHDRTTGIPGSFEKTLGGALRARARGIQVTLNYVCFRWNISELLVFRDWADRHEMGSQRDYFLIRSDLGRTFDDAFASMEQIRWIETVWPGSAFACNTNGAPGEKKVTKCSMGKNSGAVTATGEVLPCIQVRRSTGNVLERSFREIWRDDVAFSPFRDLDPGNHEKCNGCAKVGECRVCPGQNLSYNGSLFEPAEERCRITFGRNPYAPIEIPAA